MCFNASLVQTAKVVQVRFGAEWPEELPAGPRWFVSAFAHPEWPVLAAGEPDRFRALTWGLIPRWARGLPDKEASIRDKTLNARVETIGEKPSFRGSVDRKRCAVVVDGFFEWRAWEGRKYPYFVHLEGEEPFLLAGLWEEGDPEGGGAAPGGTFSVVTTEAQGIMAEVHNTKKRMPFILSARSGPLWLDPERPWKAVREEIQPLWKPLQARTVSRLVSTRREDPNVPASREAREYPELPALAVS